MFPFSSSSAGFCDSLFLYYVCILTGQPVGRPCLTAVRTIYSVAAAVFFLWLMVLIVKQYRSANRVAQPCLCEKQKKSD
ncbi:hypothetical protein TYRP_019887 [Tyrophagus putrescentiae]|nr:hypothetical protein TYRP_019887 [Tyrophagus putrescentiae]